TEVGVVVEIRAGREDPIDESRLHQRNDRAHAESGGRQRTCDRKRHGHVIVEHALDQESRALTQPRAVVGEKGLIDQIGRRFLAGDRLGIDAGSGKMAMRLRGHSDSYFEVMRSMRPRGRWLTTSSICLGSSGKSPALARRGTRSAQCPSLLNTWRKSLSASGLRS